MSRLYTSTRKRRGRKPPPLKEVTMWDTYTFMQVNGKTRFYCDGTEPDAGPSGAPRRNTRRGDIYPDHNVVITEKERRAGDGPLLHQEFGRIWWG